MMLGANLFDDEKDKIIIVGGHALVPHDSMKEYTLAVCMSRGRELGGRMRMRVLV